MSDRVWLTGRGRAVVKCPVGLSGSLTFRPTVLCEELNRFKKQRRLKVMMLKEYMVVWTT